MPDCARQGVPGRRRRHRSPGIRSTPWAADHRGALSADRARHREPGGPRAAIVCQRARVRVDATVAPDRRIAYADLHFLTSVDRLRPATLAALRVVAAPARRAGLEVAFSGGVITATHSSEAVTELIGLLVAFAILLAALGSVTAAVLPLISALVNVALAYSASLRCRDWPR